MKRNLTLDVLRGFLSWVVVFVHMVWAAGYRNSTTREKLGVWAVDGFIILSGFVISGLLLKKKEPYGVFITRRYFRLAPAFIVCILIALAVRPLNLGRYPENLLREASENSNLTYHLGAHLALLHGLIPSALLPGSDLAILPPGWSISLEFQLYLVAPLVLWAMVRYGQRVLGIVFVFSLLCLLPPVLDRLGSHWSSVGAFLPQHFFYFMIGMLLYFIADADVLANISAKWSVTPFRRSLVRLGEISYSTYLVHWPVIMTIDALLVPLSWNRSIRVGVIAVLTIPSVLLASYLLHRFVELPGIELGKRLTSKKQTLSRSEVEQIP
jgi:peptidoglycan/LPS O-acetylase OafA/YrhL